MTTQSTILAAVALASSVSLSITGSEALPSQLNQRGRPRVNGRVTVLRGNLTAEQFSVHTVRAALAREVGVADPKSLTHYLRECSADQITFVVPGLGKDNRVIYTAAIEGVFAAPLSVESETTMLVAVENAAEAASEVSEPLEAETATASDESDALAIEAEA